MSDFKEYLEETLKLAKLTNEERIILENIDEKYKYIARDKNGVLCIYESEPHKESDKDFWLFYDGKCKDITFFNHIFQNIKWEDNEPFKFR